MNERELPPIKRKYDRGPIGHRAPETPATPEEPSPEVLAELERLDSEARRRYEEFRARGVKLLNAITGKGAGEELVTEQRRAQHAFARLRWTLARSFMAIVAAGAVSAAALDREQPKKDTKPLSNETFESVFEQPSRALLVGDSGNITAGDSEQELFNALREFEGRAIFLRLRRKKDIVFFYFTRGASEDEIEELMTRPDGIPPIPPDYSDVIQAVRLSGASHRKLEIETRIVDPSGMWTFTVDPKHPELRHPDPAKQEALRHLQDRIATPRDDRESLRNDIEAYCAAWKRLGVNLRYQPHRRQPKAETI